MELTHETKARPGRRPALRKFMRQFGRDEDGSMIIFSLFLLVVSLILGGMAVDFMRFEARRATMQGVSDRAVLAAANLQIGRTEAETRAVAVDYFTKAGMNQFLTVEPAVSTDTNFRSVSVDAKMPLSTYFLKLVGLTKLNAHAAATAVEGVGNVEISLVLDISGSMEFPTYNEDGSATTFTKIQKMREAADAFVTAVLDPLYDGKISVSLVPYSQQVNIGPTLFGRLNTVHRHDFSHCIEFPDSAFSTTGINTSATYEQTQHLQTNPGPNSDATVTEPICPRYSYEQVIYVSRNLTALTDQIALLQPRAGTSIFLGLKWGLALLDSSMRSKLAPGLDAAFTGRPVDFASSSEPNATSKVIVIMTDGENQWTDLLKPEFYDSPSEYANWDSYNWPYFRDNQLDDSGVTSSDWLYTRYRTNNYPGYLYQGEGTDADMLTTNLCNAARTNGITVFAIAFEATPHGEQTMSDCATTPSHYYNSSGGELTEIFRAIAAQITDLRLIQ